MGTTSSCILKSLPDNRRSFRSTWFSGGGTMGMRESPRTRRLRSDQKALAQLAADSSILEFSPYGTPADFYMLRFHGRGFYKPDPGGEVLVREEHEVHIRLGASYPRMMPELAWKSPIFHPHISASGVVCLGGYGTYWVPSL